MVDYLMKEVLKAESLIGSTHLRWMSPETTRGTQGVEALEAHNATKSTEVRGTTTADPEQHRASSATSPAAEKDANPVDEAALMGAALAAIVALVVSPGEYGKLSSMIGATLLFVILAFYRLELRPGSPFRAFFRGAALAAVTGLCACLLISWPVQNHWNDHTNAMNDCYYSYATNNKLSPNVDNLAPDVRDAYYNCLGDEAFQPLALFWLVFTTLGTSMYFVGWMWMRRKRKRLRSDTSEKPTQSPEATEGCRVQTVDHHAEDFIAAMRRSSDLSDRTSRLLIAAAVIDGVLRVAALIDNKRRPAGRSRAPM
jgi:hypothetical protein